MTRQTISHYRILEKLREGGMGVVYKAEDTKLKRVVALKFLAAHLFKDEEAQKRFDREARAAATLHHPNVCAIHEIGEAEGPFHERFRADPALDRSTRSFVESMLRFNRDAIESLQQNLQGQTFLAMAFIEGDSLDKRIEQGLLEIPEALDIAGQIAQGLEAAHQKKIVHKDIKPGNIIVDEKGHVTVMKFGLALLTEASKLTQLDTTVGTAAYMSPEQIQGMEVDHRTDIWALGVVIYEMITGRRLPFEGEREGAVAYPIVHEEHEPLTDVSSELDRVVAKATAKEPSERYQHVDEMLVDLRSLRSLLVAANEAKAVNLPEATSWRNMFCQLVEAELMNSTPEHVHAWLSRRGEVQKWSDWGEKELEEALLTRKSDLINLALARYGTSGTVVGKLFAAVRRDTDGGTHSLGSSDHAVSEMTQVLRIAALSNRILNSGEIPWILFGEAPNIVEPDMLLTRDFVTSARSDEVLALFQNPTIHGDFLESLYKRERPFERLGQKRWQELIEASIGNPRLREEYSGSGWDGWAAYRHGCVFDAAWKLAEKVPTTEGWANILARLLKGTSEHHLSEDEVAVMIQRWRVSPRAKSYNLDVFAVLRMRLLQGRIGYMSDSEIRELKSHEDVAMRCAFYQYGDLTSEELKKAYAREPTLLLNYVLENDAIWRQSETRKALRELCWADTDDDMCSDRESYESGSEKARLEHPDWFEDEFSEPGENAGLSEDLVNLGQAIEALRFQILSLRMLLKNVLWIVSILLVFLIVLLVRRC